MALMASGRKEFTFLWLIDNYSYCWHNNRELLISPEFTVGGLENTAWTVQLYPRGSKIKNLGNINFYLDRSPNDDGPAGIRLTYELSALGTDGTALFSGGHETTFKKGVGYGTAQILKRDDVLVVRETDFLPQDTLTVRCKMWKAGMNICKLGPYFARTRIGIERISFLHKVENFSCLKPNEKKILQVSHNSKSECGVSSTVYLSDSEGQVFVKVVPAKSNYILTILEISLVDALGNVVDCGKFDNRFDEIGEYLQTLPLSLEKDIILERKNEYLPNDELSLICRCTFSTGVDFEKIEGEGPQVILKQNSDYVQKSPAGPSVVDDLKAIYNNQNLTDVELKTKTKSFPAHKILLCARSSVFSAMLTNDMKEKNTARIQVDDLEDDIVQQLLLFIYSDQLENLQWESAIKLYYAGDKYAIEKLKVKCSAFLTKNLSVLNASELLLLADNHSDSDLKEFVEVFILQNEEEVFGSDEWERLIETNPQLVIKTMHLKYKKKKGSKR